MGDCKERRMNVIYGEENLKDIQKKHTTLELDTIQHPESADTVTVYAVAGPDDISLENIIRLKQFIPVHEALIKNYKQQNWDFCEQAIQKLLGSINPFMDTFYIILLTRIVEQRSNPTENWSPVVKITEK